MQMQRLPNSARDASSPHPRKKHAASLSLFLFLSFFSPSEHVTISPISYTRFEFIHFFPTSFLLLPSSIFRFERNELQPRNRNISFTNIIERKIKIRDNQF